jgi:Tfp pilus assembly protein PilF
MNTCPRCGTGSYPEDKYCGECGYNLAFQPQTHTTFTQKELKVSDIRMNLGVIYLKQGKYESAIENFKKVLEDDPTNELVQQMLEQSQASLNRTL